MKILVNTLNNLLHSAQSGAVELNCSARRLPVFAIAAVEPVGSLLARVRRLIGHTSAAPAFAEGFGAAVVALVGVGVLMSSATVTSGAAPRPVALVTSSVFTTTAQHSLFLQPVDTIRRPGLTAVFEAKLRRDGLLKGPLYEYTLSNQRFVVNGSPQPAAVAAEYRALYEATMGQPLLPDQSVNMRKIADQPTSGQPAIQPGRAAAVAKTSAKKPATGANSAHQKAPSAPLSPLAMRQQQLVVLHEMQANGLLTADEKEAQLVFLDNGLTINGRPQPAAVAARYRELLRVPVDGTSKQVNGPARITIHE
jgi:hypothetical protein